MTLENRKFIIGASAGVLLFFLVNHFFFKKENELQENKKQVRPEDVETAVRAFKTAYEKPEDQQTLNALNKQIKEEFGCTVSYDSAIGKYVVKDTNNKIIKSV